MGLGSVGGQRYPVGKCGGSRESWRSKLSCREVWVGQGRVGGQSYPVGKCGWVKGELEVKYIM